MCEVPPAQKFPVLFSLAANKETKVRECYVFHQNKVNWCPQFRRDLKDWMMEGWLSLMDLDPHGFFFGKSFL